MDRKLLDIICCPVTRSSLELLSEPSAGFFAPLLLYRSAYHPPPLRMKPAPPDT